MSLFIEKLKTEIRYDLQARSSVTTSSNQDLYLLRQDIAVSNTINWKDTERFLQIT